jgi:hypothetical protein
MLDMRQKKAVTKVSLRQGCVGEYFLKKTTPVSPETNDFRLKSRLFFFKIQASPHNCRASISPDLLKQKKNSPAGP